MALITTEERNDLMALYVIMFEGAPTAAKLAELVGARESGQTLAQVAHTLSSEAAFSSVYPAFLTGQEFADKLVGQLLGNEVPSGARDWAINWVLTAFQSGKAREQVILEAVQAVRTTPNVNYAPAKDALANKVEVASYYALDLAGSGSVQERQQILSSITSNADTVTNGKASVDSVLRPITLGDTELFQVHALFKLLFDAAPGFTFLKEAQAIIKSGLTIEGTRYEGITGLADFLLTKVQTSGQPAISSTALVDLISTNLHAREILSPADLDTFQEALTTYFHGNGTHGSAVPSLLNVITGVSSSYVVPLQKYLIDSIRVAQTYSMTSTNTTTDLATLQLKDEPLLASGAITFTDTAADDTFSTQQGTLTVAPGFATGTVTFGIEGGAVSGTTSTKVLTYGTVSLNTTTGAYTFTPKDAALESLKVATTEYFKLTATDSATVPNSTWTQVDVHVAGANDATTFSGSWLANVNAASTHINPITGTLVAVDRDAGDTLFIPQTNAAVVNGTFSITQQGAWVYTPTTLVENAQFKIPVTTGGNVTQTIVITVIGQAVEAVPA